MDLVHKQDVVFLQIGQQRRQIAGLFDGRSRGDADVYAHLRGDDSRQRRLAQTRGAVEQHMIQRLRAPPRRLNEHIEVLLGLRLPDVFLQRVGAQGNLPTVLQLKRCRHQRILKNIVSEINTHNNTSIPDSIPIISPFFSASVE